MAKRGRKQALTTAEKYANYLLYEITGGNMGVKPEVTVKNSSATFGEKRGLLDSLIKIAALERESESEDDQPSGLDALRKEIEKRKKHDVSGASWNTGNTGRAKSGSDEPAGFDDSDSTSEG